MEIRFVLQGWNNGAFLVSAAFFDDSGRNLGNVSNGRTEVMRTGDTYTVRVPDVQIAQTQHFEAPVERRPGWTPARWRRRRKDAERRG